MTQSKSGGHGLRPFQFSEYENAFRRPSTSKRTGYEPVAGVASSKTASASEANKRAHLNRRAQWNGAWPGHGSGPATRSTTPPRMPGRARTPPRASGSSVSTPRASLSSAPEPRASPRGAAQSRASTPPRSTRDAYHTRRHSEPGQDTMSSADASGGPSTCREAQAGSCDQPDAPCDEELPGIGTPLRVSTGGSSSSSTRASSTKYLGDDPTEELCCRWEAWAQSISQAAEEGATLPPPPVPQPHAPGVTVPLMRVLEASAFAAAALARGSMDAKGLRTLADSLENDLSQSRAEVRALQVEVDALEKEVQESSSNRSLRRQVEDLEREAEGAEAEVRCLRERSEELTSLLAAEAAERKQAEHRLQTERSAPCSQCEEVKLRLTDVADEVESLRAALKDAEARRRKEVEDALWIADNAHAKHEQVLSVLRQVLSSDGRAEGMHAAAAILPQASHQAGATTAASTASARAVALRASAPGESSRIASMGTSTRAPEPALFERIDFDKNGMISRQEFRRAWKDGLVGSETGVELAQDMWEGSVASRSSAQPATPREKDRGASPRASPSSSRSGAAVSPRGASPRASPSSSRSGAAVSPRSAHRSSPSGGGRGGIASASALRGAGTYSGPRVEEHDPDVDFSRSGASASPRSSRISPQSGAGRTGAGSHPGRQVDEHDMDVEGVANRLEREVVQLCRALGGDDRTPKSGGGDSSPCTPRGGATAGLRSRGGTPGASTPRSGSRTRGAGASLGYSGTRR